MKMGDNRTTNTSDPTTSIQRFSRKNDGSATDGVSNSLRSDDLNSVSKLYTQDDFRQLVVAIEATPAFLGGLGELEDHGERGLVRETALRTGGAMADGREGAFDDICRAQMLPVLGGEVVKGQQRVAILG
jgi:hypothetical protein